MKMQKSDKHDQKAGRPHADGRPATVSSHGRAAVLGSRLMHARLSLSAQMMTRPKLASVSPSSSALRRRCLSSLVCVPAKDGGHGC